jgi:poly(A) polymerase
MDKSAAANEVVRALRKAGHAAYFAGGCVRDQLRGVEPKDFDVATSAKPEIVQGLFPKTVPVGVQFGVVLVLHEGHPFEVATFRSEGGYADGRRPTEVAFSTVEEDAKRRDFTVNGLYFDTEKSEVLDFVGGREDLSKKVIRTIGRAEDRFQEDHLRMLRAVRFAVQLGFEIEPATFAAVKANAEKITRVSAERIRDELTKTLTSPQPARGTRLLDECGLLKHVLPEIELMKGVEQPMQYHPEGDVFIHTMMLLDGLSNAPIELAMGALLHDVAKPQTFVRAPDRIRFHGHDRIGAEMSKEICKRLAFSNDQTDLICSLVAEHLRFKDAFQMRLSTLKRFLRLPRFDLHLELHRLDCLASHGKLDAYEFCKQKYEEMLKEPPPPLKLVTGQDLIEMGLKPGPDFSRILRAVEDAILEGAVKDKESALAYARTQIPGTKP